jgi:hypothetical protein
MKPFGYLQTKPTFLCREYPPHLIAFFHFHKFTFGPRFRVHFGIRVLNSAFEAHHLNGPSIEHAGVYGDDDESVSGCIQMLTELLIRDGLPWVESWLDPQRLISAADSPLQKDERDDLRSALERPDSQRVAVSYELFGVEPSNPQGGANRGQPSRSEINQTSAAAAPRRAP